MLVRVMYVLVLVCTGVVMRRYISIMLGVTAVLVFKPTALIVCKKLIGESSDEICFKETNFCSISPS